MRSTPGPARDLSTTERGRNAEKIARRRLEKLGYRIVETNHRNKAGEIDVVACDGDTLCFVEVKARASGEFGGAIAAIDWRKQQRLRRAASLYLALKPWRGPCRFDVVTLDRESGVGAGGRTWKVRIYENAF